MIYSFAMKFLSLVNGHAFMASIDGMTGNNDRLFAEREEFFDGRLLGADELSEEAPLGKKLVDQDGADRVGLLVGLEVQEVLRYGPPHADRLVRLAGVGGDGVLKDRLDGLGHVGFGDGNEVVVHGSFFLQQNGGHPQPFTAPKAEKQTFLCRTSTWVKPTWRSRSSWNSSGRGVSSFST